MNFVFELFVSNNKKKVLKINILSQTKFIASTPQTLRFSLGNSRMTETGKNWIVIGDRYLIHGTEPNRNSFNAQKL